MYIPSWPCPTASQISLEPQASLPYPLAAEGRKHFYVARSGIYHLFRKLDFRAPENVLVPDYHSGNETSAMRAAGVPMRFYPIGLDLQPDRDAITRLCTPETRALYVIHFIGFPQPMDWITDFCRRRGILLIEDCALSFLSEYNGRPLGSFGDYSVHCLYKTLPVPNGAVLTKNRATLPGLEHVETTQPSKLAVLGRSTELILESFRSRFPIPGAALAAMKAAMGRALTAASVERERVGTIGFDVTKVNVGMSRDCHWLLSRFNYNSIRERRRSNYLWMDERLKGKVSTLSVPLGDGACPLFYPILVENKSDVAASLRRRGIGVVEFWNAGDPEAEGSESRAAMFLRKHVLELPIHQNVTPKQLEYVAREVETLVRPVEAPLQGKAVCYADS